MGLQAILLLIVLTGTCPIAANASAQADTPAKPGFSPQSKDDLTEAVDKCLNKGYDTYGENFDAQLDAAVANSGGDSFTFVMIPADKGALKEVTKPKAGGLAHDELDIYVTKHFTAQDENTKAPPGVTKRKAADDIVILQLFRACAFNDFLSVDIYSDGEAEAKNKPLNIRASNIMLACGFKDKVVYGDAFLTRAYDNNEYPWERRDFFARDAHDNADWVLDASVDNEGKQIDQVNMRDGSSIYSREKQGPVAWSQTRDDVEVTIAVPKGVRGRDIAVTIKPNLIQFRLKNGYSMTDEEEKRDQKRDTDQTLLHRIQSGLIPFQKIDPDESSWSLVDGHLVITLNKKEPLYGSRIWWRSLNRVN